MTVWGVGSTREGNTRNGEGNTRNTEVNSPWGATSKSCRARVDTPLDDPSMAFVFPPSMLTTHPGTDAEATRTLITPVEPHESAGERPTCSLVELTRACCATIEYADAWNLESDRVLMVVLGTYSVRLRAGEFRLGERRGL